MSLHAPLGSVIPGEPARVARAVVPNGNPVMRVRAALGPITTIGLTKTRLIHVLVAAARDVLRVAAWLAEEPLARTRRSAFAALAPATG